LGAHLGQLIGSIQTNPRSLVFFENPGFHLWVRSSRYCASIDFDWIK
jgi:hypothetical protein